MRECGKALEHFEVQKAPGVHGDMIVVQENSAALNRYSNIARFQVSGVNDPQPMPPLPLLHDAVPVVDGSAQVRAERRRTGRRHRLCAVLVVPAVVTL
jgi:hypothetical protein